MVSEFSAFIDLLIGSSQIDVLSVDLSLEVSIFSIELFNSLFIISLVLGFLGSQFIQCINDLSSEFVEGINDLSDDVLVGEVLVESELEECLNHGSILDSVPLFL